MGTEIKSIPKVRQVYYTTYAALPTTGVAIGDLGYATDTLRLYRWSGAAWQPITAVSSINSGSYTGDNSVNRAIPHGLGSIPCLVVIFNTQAVDTGGDSLYHIVTGIGRIYYGGGGANSRLTVTAPDATNFYVGNATGYANTANENLITYSWVAIK